MSNPRQFSHPVRCVLINVDSDHARATWDSLEVMGFGQMEFGLGGSHRMGVELFILPPSIPPLVRRLSLGVIFNPTSVIFNLACFRKKAECAEGAT